MGTSLGDYDPPPGQRWRNRVRPHMTTCMEARDCSLHPSTCGSLCDVVSASKYEIVCDTRPRTTSVDQTSIIDMQVDWNYEPFYFECASQSCTPPGCVPPAANASACVLVRGRLGARLVYEPPAYIARATSTFALRHRTESPVADFDWFTAGEGPHQPGDLRLGGPTTALTMTVTGERRRVRTKLTSSTTNSSASSTSTRRPRRARPARLRRGPRQRRNPRRRRYLNPTVDILPRVTSFSPNMGSLAGGTTLYVRCGALVRRHARHPRRRNVLRRRGDERFLFNVRHGRRGDGLEERLLKAR